MKFIRQGWYVAGWAEEIADGKPLARTLLETPVVLFRDVNGRSAALEDRCPHRFAPLSRGKVSEHGLQCPYHGLQFDGRGACTHNPFGSQPPPRARVQAFAVQERYGMLWIWMGDIDSADPGLLPHYAVLEDANWHAIRGYLLAPGNYLLGIDNLMDLTHAEFLHDASLGSPALKTAHYEVFVEGPRTVHSNRWFDAGPLPTAMEHAFPTGGKPVTHWNNMRWDAPSSLMLHNGACWPGESREQGMNAYTTHLLTPETATSTHYFFTLSRPVNAARLANNDDFLRETIRNIFANEDGPILQAIQHRIGDADLWDLKPAMLPGDEGAVRVRNSISKLLEAESGLL